MSLQRFKQQQTRLAELLKEASQTVSTLNMTTQTKILANLSKKVEKDTFKVMITGRFKGGKSTFINSLLGDEILPSDFLPATAIINEVKWGAEKKAIIFFKDPLPQRFLADIPQKAREHINRHQGSIPPLEISYDEIDKYVLIPSIDEEEEMDDKKAEELMRDVPYDKVELYFPLDLLQNNVELIDSPGTDEDIRRTQVVYHYLPKTDATIVVFRSEPFGGSGEIEFIDNKLRPNGYVDNFYIVNCWPHHTPQQLERLKAHARSRLKSRTNFGENGIFFISALAALNAKKNKDEPLLNKSGLQEFENVLSEYLINSRGKAKLSQPARELKQIVTKEAIQKQIPHQRAMLDAPLIELRKRYDDVKPKLDILLTKKDNLRRRVEELVRQMIPDIRRHIGDYFIQTCDNILVWMEEIEVEAPLSINIFKLKETKAQLTVVCEEIAKKMAIKFEADTALWTKDSLLAFLNNRMGMIRTTIEGAIEVIYNDLDAITAHLSQVATDATTRDGGSHLSESIFQYGGEMTENFNAFDENFVKEFISVFVVCGIMGLIMGGPIGIAVGAVVAVLSMLLDLSNSVIKKCKEKLAEETVKVIKEKSSGMTEEMIEKIETAFAKNIDNLISGLDAEIHSVDTKVQDIIGQLEKGQADVDKKKAEILNCEQKLQAISTEIDNLMREIG